MQSAGGIGAAATLIIASPFILVLYPMALLVGGRSEVPVILDRYSYSAAAFIPMAVVLYIAFAVALLRRNVPILVLALIALVGVTFALATSNAIMAEQVNLVILAVARFLAAISLVVVAVLGVRNGRAKWAPSALVGAALLFVPSAVDATFLIWHTTTQEPIVWPENVYRPSYDLTKLSEHDVVLVGDSFIWGQGVAINQRVGDVLEAQLQRQDPKAKVYSLGVVGWGLKDYANAIREIPSGTRVRSLIISFYQNDMLGLQSAAGWLDPLSEDMGRSSISARLLLDFARVSFAPTLEGYMQSILSDYDEAGPGFATRWKALVDALHVLHALAVPRSLECPLLVIVPMLSTTDGEKWLSAHRRVAAAARAAGFEVLDLYDDFKTGTPQALGYRAAANDTHLGVEGNRMFADKLLRALGDGAPKPSRP